VAVEIPAIGHWLCACELRRPSAPKIRVVVQDQGKGVSQKRNAEVQSKGRVVSQVCGSPSASYTASWSSNPMLVERELARLFPRPACNTRVAGR
jgi:hypothetical protein